MNRPHVVHLIDDTKAGGVMRVLDYILTSHDMALTARHSLRQVTRGALSFQRIDADVIVSHLSINWRGLPALIALRAVHSDIPLIHVEHSYTECFTALNVRHKGRFFALLRTTYALFNRVVAVSKAQGKWLVSRGLVSENNLCVIQPIVDLKAFEALPPASEKVHVVGAMGRLSSEKGFDTLIKAFLASPKLKVSLHVYGDGPERSNLEALAAQDSRIRFFGFIDQPAQAMAAVDAIAMPSRWESFGLVALEARAAKRKLLVSTVDGLNDHIEEGAIGVVGQSISAWSRALETMITSRTSDQVKARTCDSIEHEFSASWAHLIGVLTCVNGDQVLAS